MPEEAPRVAVERRSLAVLLCMAAIAASFVYVVLQPFLQAILFAVVLAIAANPLHVWVSQRIRSKGLAALTTTFLLLIVVLIPLMAIGITMVREARDTYVDLAKQSAHDGGWSIWLGQFLEPPINWLAEKTGMPPLSVHQYLLEKGQAFSSTLVRWSGSILGNLTATLGTAILSLFVMLFLFVHGPAIRNELLAWLPLPRARKLELLSIISDSIIANVYGIVAVGLAQGLLVGIGFWIAGLSGTFMWGAIAALCSLVPLIGPALVWLPGVLVLLAQGLWGKALFLTLWGVLVVGMSDNILRPWVLSGRTEMNTLVVFFALMGGAQAFGFIGIFAGPVIFSVALAVFRMLGEEYFQEHGPPNPT